MLAIYLLSRYLSIFFSSDTSFKYLNLSEIVDDIQRNSKRWFQLPTHKAKMGVALGKYEYTLLLHPTEVDSKSL